MNTRGLVEIVLLTVGRDAGLIDDRLFTLLALMAIVTTVVTAPALRAIGPQGAGRMRAGPETGATGTETAPHGLHRAVRRR
jgi:Kef-type K+ transport system membrane component KefB